MDPPRPFIIGGERRTSSRAADVIFPYDGSTVARVALAGAGDMDDAVRSAGTGAAEMARLSSGARSAVLERMASLIEACADRFAETIVLEAGKTTSMARTEVDRAAATLRIASEEARRLGGEIVDLDWTRSGEGCIGVYRRFPVGIVLAITPFNFPLSTVCHKLGPALAAGNAVIVRPSTKAPLSALALGECALEAGCPSAAVSVVPSSTGDAERLAGDPRIGLLSFTGSPEVGWHLKGVAGRTRVTLEHGGNASVIIEPDADLARAAERCVQGGFANAGQVCLSVQRIFLHVSVYDEGLGLIVDGARELTVGDPRDHATGIGPMISEAAAGAAETAVREAIDAGARCECGGTRQGTLFAPTVLTETDSSMRVNAEEIFAPVITITPYDGFDEALTLANASPFGLQQSIFTRDIGSVARAFGQSHAGTVIVNDTAFRVDQMPYGGSGASGLGREGPRYAIDEMTESRLLVTRDPDLGS
ncbi:MAG: aldehyde dehydrogenase family protein [Methanospirillum sp.]|nr:aldehyde dehydrogenase family protein [Methanospirillum sp.]